MIHIINNKHDLRSRGWPPRGACRPRRTLLYAMIRACTYTCVCIYIYIYTIYIHIMCIYYRYIIFVYICIYIYIYIYWLIVFCAMIPAHTLQLPMSIDYARARNMEAQVSKFRSLSGLSLGDTYIYIYIYIYEVWMHVLILFSEHLACIPDARFVWPMHTSDPNYEEQWCWLHHIMSWHTCSESDANIFLYDVCFCQGERDTGIPYWPLSATIVTLLTLSGDRCDVRLSRPLHWRIATALSLR